MNRFFYLDAQNQQLGPISPEEFGRYGVNASTQVWKQGMTSWMRAGDIPELRQFFQPVPPPPPGGNGFPPTGNLGGNSQPQIQPDNYLTWAILSTIFCCLPFGIVAIVKASKVNGLYMSGQYAEAQAMSEDAKKWTLISAGSGLGLCILSFIVGFLSAL